MLSERFVRRVRIAAPAAEVFQWHARPGALERLTPPWEPVQVLERTGGIENGARVVLGASIGPFRFRWVAEHRDYQEGQQFRDVQVSGPFALWDHTHRVEPDGPDACFLEDDITYALPLGAIGRVLGGPLAQRSSRSTGLNALSGTSTRLMVFFSVASLPPQADNARPIPTIETTILDLITDELPFMD
jgi:ligand-binding SRPBCC domain-containing protein